MLFYNLRQKNYMLILRQKASNKLKKTMMNNYKFNRKSNC